MSRPVLSLRPKPDSAQPAANDLQNRADNPLDPMALVSGAIARRLCVRARYNGGEVVLQPALLYREHDAPFLLAVTVSRDGNPPREPKLGTFRLTGLNDLAVTELTFAPGTLHRGYVVQAGWDVVAKLSAAAIEGPAVGYRRTR